LPGFAADGDLWDGVLIPCWQMLTTTVFAYLPAGLFFSILLYRMAAATAANPGVVLAGASPTPGVAAVLVLVLLILLGGFIWPMLVLVVACGSSVKAMFQLDLILETIRRSFPAYALTVFAVYVSFAVQAGVIGMVWSRMGDTTNRTDDWMAILGLPTLFAGINLYFDIVVMRAIGYYYCHFKHRFAWSWG
jgi:hypothetical protein